MPYTFFYEHFPEVAKCETRTLKLLDGSSFGLPEGEYAFLEMFCNERKCDCRRVFFYVVSLPENEVKAVIAYGWEKPAFYAKWMGNDDPEMVEELRGPMLNIGSPQSSLAAGILDLVKDVLARDKEYVERIKTHYRIFRSKVERISDTKRRRGKIKLKR